MDKLSQDCKEVIAIGLIGILYTLKNFLPVWMRILKAKLTRSSKRLRQSKLTLDE